MSRKNGSSDAEARAERLAAALRANLRRRKDQDRARKAAQADDAAPGGRPETEAPEADDRA